MSTTANGRWYDDIRSAAAGALEEAVRWIEPDSDDDITERWTGDEEEWQAYLNERFEDTVQHAMDRSEYWEEHFEDIDLGSFDLFEDGVPVIDSDEVRANQPPETEDFRLELDTEQEKSVFMTSGTTGVPKSYFYTQDDWDRDSRRIGARTLELAGVDTDDVVANYFPKTGTNISGPAADAAVREHGAGLLSFGEQAGPVEQFEGMEKYDVTVLAGLTSQMEALARQMEDSGLDPSTLDIEKVMVAGEFSTDEKREWIADRFGADDVVDFYGSTEFSFSGIESENGNINFYEDQVHIAAYDEDGNRLEDGEEGLLVFTYLKEEDQEVGMPPLGLKIGDYGRVVERHKDMEGYPVSEVDVYGKADDEFVVGAVDLRPAFFEKEIREYGQREDLTGEYKIVIEDELGEGTDLELQVEAWDDHDGYEDGLEEHILDQHAYLQDTVQQGAVDFNVNVKEELEFAPGKPGRVEDRRYDE